MKSKIIFFSAVLLLASAAVSLIHDRGLSTADASNGVNTKLDMNKLEVDDIHLDIPSINAVISKEAAIQAAKQAFPEWANAKTITVEYHLITNHSFRMIPQQAIEKNPMLKSKYMDKLPAYIVSFGGLNYPSLGRPGEPSVMHHECNVIVDATTGEPLMGFSHR